MHVILYTTRCPKCTVLANKLRDKRIPFTSCEDVNLMKSKGIDTVPVLDVDGKQMNFSDANTWINEQAEREV